MLNTQPNAIIAEDESLLAQALRSELGNLWPELRIDAVAQDGQEALEQALALQPDILFLDIRMPGLTGLEAAQAIVEDWPSAKALPLIVFVTAYDQYAMQAFERAAVDYIQKPVQTARLAQCCERLKNLLSQRQQSAPVEPALDQLRNLLGALSRSPTTSVPNEPPLRVIQAGVGSAIHMVPIEEVIYLEAADKYIRVVTREREHLIRSSLRELLPRLDTSVFWQIHRSTVVRADAIATATRDETGKVAITLRGHKDKLTASRMYAHLFRAM